MKELTRLMALSDAILHHKYERLTNKIIRK